VTGTDKKWEKKPTNLVLAALCRYELEPNTHPVGAITHYSRSHISKEQRLLVSMERSWGSEACCGASANCWEVAKQKWEKGIGGYLEGILIVRTMHSVGICS
jgi:hypothetical protein